MNSVWQRLTLSDLPISQWRVASYFYRLVGVLGQWRKGSWLLQWADSLGAVLVSLVLVLAPFVSNPLIGVLLVAAGAYWVLLTLSENGKPGITPIHLLVLLYWGIAAVAVAFSPVKAQAFSGWLKLTLYLLMFALSARVLRSPRLTSWITTIFLLVALVVSIYGVRQQFFGAEQLATWNDPTSPFADDPRVYSYLGNPNLLASYLLPAIALSAAAIFAWQGWLPKALAATMFIVNSACLYFTDSRGGWIGMVFLIAAFLLLLYVWFRNRFSPFWRIWLLPIVFGTLAALLFVAFLFVEPLRFRVLSIFAGRQDSSNNVRLNVWLAAIDMIRDRPIIGIGPGNEAFNRIYPLYMRTRYSALSAYSVFLDTAVETGLIGLSCLFWLIAVTVDRGVSQIRRLRAKGDPQGFWLIGAIAGMVGILAHGAVDTVFHRPEVNTLWWLMVAIIAGKLAAETEDGAGEVKEVEEEYEGIKG
ncbi:MAG: putative bicarbonate transporter, IctB family [Hydrococcus sp. C42_A2020_068]|nr:putative bicarbonate transporter, IctB family [Hydrococcus sp. C42_A2020_068]